MLLGFPICFALVAFNPRSNISRALAVNPGTAVYQDDRNVYARELEVPPGNGVGTARAIAHAYGDFANCGRELGLRAKTLEALAARAIPASRGFYDERRVSPGRGPLLPGLHEAEPGVAVRKRRPRLWVAGIRRRPELR